MFDKVLIANRGAIACRIIRTLRRMGVGSRGRLFRGRRRSPCTCRRPTRPSASARRRPAQSYLRRRQDPRRRAPDAAPQAIHPGYGFLSRERRTSPRPARQPGIAFIGPTPAADARLRPQAHGARTGPAQPACRCCPAPACWPTWARRAGEAARIGYPVMLKSTAGGGGIGMRLCWSADELAEAFAVGGAPGAQQLQGRRRLPGEVRRAGAPHRGADLRRRPGRRDRAGRARLLGAAAQPEGDRGNAGARPRAEGCAQRLLETAVRPGPSGRATAPPARSSSSTTPAPASSTSSK